MNASGRLCNKGRCQIVYTYLHKIRATSVASGLLFYLVTLCQKLTTQVCADVQRWVCVQGDVQMMEDEDVLVCVQAIICMRVHTGTDRCI